ncbi:6-phosphogluconate phosphatase [Lonsdalea quercina]|uniref:Haloacid dehalogenase superfamily, subfamily IA, variant 3 with third motif having DD or ED n=1 Tax=Lonsdalea quercina TaxID=71657 RepID=A0A1H4CFD1_9GAMM|nr:6-phosphogluconate phosphatase [Lonsdalea quercina]SEA59116.1 haloacid dehalogenase superfamily, subfamily IA, variant 3 with third motif having DD or ED [Lonsdalea quercina]
MSQIECIFFDCDGTLVDTEVLCCQAYVNVFAAYNVSLALEQFIAEFKGVRLHDIILRTCERYHLTQDTAVLEQEYRDEIARLFDAALQPIPGVRDLLEKLQVPTAVVSNGPVSKMQRTLGKTALLPFFGDNLYSGYDIQTWKPDPAILYYAADQMKVAIEQCILVEDSEAGVQAGISAGIPVFYYCADALNRPIHHPLVTQFDDMRQLPTLWRERGWSQLTPER